MRCTIGSNTIGISGVGLPGGRQTTLFIATTSPSGGSGGTTATATILGNSTTVGFDANQNLWARRALLDDFQRNALSVTFTNGGETTTVNTGSLFGINAMPLAIDFTISGDPFSPLLSWLLPVGQGIDIDRVSIAFFNDDTNAEIGTRVFRPGTTTSYQLQSVLPEGLNIVFDLRLIDLVDSIEPGQEWGAGDILSQSRTYLSYSVPARVPRARRAGPCVARGRRRSRG